MQTLFDKIEVLDLKIRQLVQKTELLRNGNKQLIEENTKLKKINSQYLEQIEKLGEEIEVLRKNNQNTSILSEDGKQSFKSEIAEYIKEIDACIEILNN